MNRESIQRNENNNRLNANRNLFVTQQNFPSALPPSSSEIGS